MIWIRKSKKTQPVVAISMAPTRNPWGGSSVFVWQLMDVLWRRGIRTVFHLRQKPDAVVMIDPRMDHAQKRFGLEELRKFRKEHPEVPVLHRINECDQRKGTNDIDELLRQTNELADYTVFISEWLRDYFAQKWFDSSRPHTCIYNGADPRVFHPFGRRRKGKDEPLIIVTHHWSSHALKGYDVYAEVDHLLSKGRLDGFQFRIIGNVPEGSRWYATEVIPPLAGAALAEKLREGDIYLTASRWEPCGMHHVEGAQCGMPLVYHEDGGGIVEAGRKYGLGFRDDPGVAIRDMAARLPEFRRKLAANMPSGDRMTIQYAEIVCRLLGHTWVD